MTDFLSDADVWTCYCAARLAELDPLQHSMTVWMSTAQALHLDAKMGSVDPLQAAERYMANEPHRVAA